MTKRTWDIRVFRKATEAKRQNRSREFLDHVVTSRFLPPNCRDLDALEDFYEMRRPFYADQNCRTRLPEHSKGHYLDESDLTRWFRLVEGDFQNEVVQHDWSTPLRSIPLP